jgi:hypothetical protein
MRHGVGIVFALCVFMTAANAAEQPKGEAKIDPTQVVRDPRGHAFLPCDANGPKNCEKDQTLGFFVYLALGAQRTAPTPDPETAVRAALGWKIYEATAPLEISEAQRVMIRKALFANIQMPNVAYATCRMIGDPTECDKP